MCCEGPGSWALFVCLERGVFVGFGGDLHDPGEGSASGLLVIHDKRNGLVVEVLRVEVLADGELPAEYGLGVAPGLGGTRRTNTERDRAKGGKGLALETFVEDLEDPAQVGAILTLTIFVLSDLVLLLYLDLLPGVGAGDILSGAGRGKRQGHS